jgi:hypothetical protein
MSIKIWTVDNTIVAKANAMVSSCESCDSRCDIPFSWFLACIRGGDIDGIDYFLSDPARCPHCSADIFGDTLVRSGKAIRRYAFPRLEV